MQESPREPQKVRPAALRLEVLEDRCLLTSSISEFALASASSFPIGIIAGPDGNLWFTQCKAIRSARSTP